jgi:hypothetical protein
MVAVMQAHPRWQGIKKDHLAFIIHSIVIQKVNNDEDRWLKLGKKDGFVPLHSKVLEGKVPDYRRHLDYLMMAGIIETDGQYVRGVVSTGYRFTAPYRGVNYKKVEVRDFVLCQKIKVDDVFSNRNAVQRQYPYLLQWFKSGKLQIDKRAAFRWLQEQEGQEMEALAGKRLPQARFSGERAAIAEKYANQRLLVTRIAEHDYYYIVDNTGKRLHTNLTNLSKELRNFITYDGEQLVSVDIRNSQPYMSLALFDRRFWEPNPKADYPTLWRLNKEMYKGKDREDRHLHYIIMFVDSSTTLIRRDFQTEMFFRKVIQGEIYEHLQEVFERAGYHLGNTPDEKRSKVKKIALTSFFDDDRKVYNREPGSYVQIFRRHFPFIARVFEYVKEDDYRALAVLLQRIESFLLLDKICHRISQERPDMPLFTIHDNIVTTAGNEGYVQSVMREELARIMGAAPQLTVEYWKRPISVRERLLQRVSYLTWFELRRA